MPATPPGASCPGTRWRGCGVPWRCTGWSEASYPARLRRPRRGGVVVPRGPPAPLEPAVPLPAQPAGRSSSCRRWSEARCVRGGLGAPRPAELSSSGPLPRSRGPVAPRSTVPGGFFGSERSGTAEVDAPRNLPDNDPVRAAVRRAQRAPQAHREAARRAARPARRPARPGAAAGRWSWRERLLRELYGLLEEGYPAATSRTSSRRPRCWPARAWLAQGDLPRHRLRLEPPPRHHAQEPRAEALHRGHPRRTTSSSASGRPAPARPTWRWRWRSPR